jgi:hypothetical protein
MRQTEFVEASKQALRLLIETVLQHVGNHFYKRLFHLVEILGPHFDLNRQVYGLFRKVFKRILVILKH